MLTMDKKYYDVVAKDNKEFIKIFNNAWKEIGVTTESFRKSHWLLIRNLTNQPTATIEFALYNKGYENPYIECVYPFAKFQREDIQLLYIDKLAISKEHRAVLENMFLLMQTIFFYMQEVRTDKKQVLVALIQERFYNKLKRILNVKIHELASPINGEIPILINLEENREVIDSNDWLKIKF